MAHPAPSDSIEFPVGLAVVSLSGSLVMPDTTHHGLVVLGHGNGNSRFSPRNRDMADFLNRAAPATLLFDLLTAEGHDAHPYIRQFRPTWQSRTVERGVRPNNKRYFRCRRYLVFYGMSTPRIIDMQLSELLDDHYAQELGLSPLTGIHNGRGCWGC